jgi:hypothetical protein
MPFVAEVFDHNHDRTSHMLSRESEGLTLFCPQFKDLALILFSSCSPTPTTATTTKMEENYEIKRLLEMGLVRQNDFIYPRSSSL